MVPGLGSFREKFKDYTDYYTIIGGTACDILLSEADLPFRATKDIDMILIMEDNFPEFASIFWEYIPLVDKGNTRFSAAEGRFCVVTVARRTSSTPPSSA